MFVHSGLTARREIFSILDRWSKAGFAQMESTQFMACIRKLYSKGEEQVHIRADNLTEREHAIIRACNHERYLTDRVADILPFNSLICSVRGYVEGCDLYRVELVPEIYRALGTEISRRNMNLLMLFANYNQDSACRINRNTFTNFQNASALEKEQFPNGDDIQYLIDRDGKRNLLGDEYELED